MKSAISSSSKTTPQGSSVYVKRLSPQGVKTIGIHLTEDQAVDLATKILIVAKNKEAKGLILLTGHEAEGRVTVIRNMK